MSASRHGTHGHGRHEADHHHNHDAHHDHHHRAVSSPPEMRDRRVAAATVWTCPMHPEIRRDAPGACPICGMALEPLAPSAEEGENAELVDMTRRFWISLALTSPLLWSMLGELIPAINPMRFLSHAAV